MQAGTMLAHYRVEALIGKGGMGEVYRAQDTKLSRDVALKILPREFSSDSDRMARFEREAKVLASLHHPNIASIFGFETTDECTFLVMELVEGDDLAVLLQNGPLPVDEAVEIAHQIAVGLEEAHEGGIIHRDLKPANIKRTPDGKVKVLDFGLARAYSGQTPVEEEVSSAPTLTSPMTQVGTVLGTAAYMSPEQARGKDVDRRADIWAFGAILFEMLTGKRLFVGETASDTLAGILKSEPEWETLPSDLPFQVERVLRRCLAKDPMLRLRDIGEARVRLENPEAESGMFSGPVAAMQDSGGKLGRLVPWILLVIVAAIAGAGWVARPSVPEANFAHYDLAFDFGESFGSPLKPTFSPDGLWVAAALPDSLGQSLLVLRSLETGSQETIPGTKGVSYLFWSPDSKFLGFFQDRRMRKLHLESGTQQIVTSEIQGDSRGGTWSIDDQILFAPGPNSALKLVDAEGGEATSVTTLDSTMVDGSHRWPHFLPDGRRFLYTVWSNVADERAEKGGIFLGSLDSGQSRRILRDVSQAVLAPTGQVLFHRNGRLMAAEFDIALGTVKGDPTLVAREVGFSTSNGSLWASTNNRGDVIYGPPNPENQHDLVWLTKDSRVQGVVQADIPLIFGLELSPTGSHYLLEQLDEVGSVEIWIGDIRRQSVSRLSRFDSDCWGAVFSPDGSEVLYGVATMAGSIQYRHDISGAKDAVPILEIGVNEALVTAQHWFAPDQALVVSDDPETKVAGIHLLNLAEGSLQPVLSDSYDQFMPRLSPDGRWLAYVSEESGISEIYVRNWPDLDRKWQISRDGGVFPSWGDDGTQLAYASLSSRDIMAVDFIEKDGEPDISLPRIMTRVPRTAGRMAFASDHQRYLLGLGRSNVRLSPFRVLVGWGQRQAR